LEEKNVVSGRRLGHMPLIESKNQYTKNRNKETGQDAAKVFFINN